MEIGSTWPCFAVPVTVIRGSYFFLFKAFKVF